MVDLGDGDWSGFHAGDQQEGESVAVGVWGEPGANDSHGLGGRGGDGLALRAVGKDPRAAELETTAGTAVGYSPEVIVGQSIYALCSGGGCLSDSEGLNEDPLALELLGVERFAYQSQAGE